MAKFSLTGSYKPGSQLRVFTVILFSNDINWPHGNEKAKRNCVVCNKSGIHLTHKNSKQNCKGTL